MNNELSKRYYKIREVAEIFNIPPSTIRYWEKEFPELQPKRSGSNRRFYNDKDINLLKIIYFLLKERGLKIESAKEQLQYNIKNISRKIEIIEKLEKIKSELNSLSEALRLRSEI